MRIIRVDLFGTINRMDDPPRMTRFPAEFSRCDAVTASDYVEFSNYMARDRKYPRNCGQQKEFDVYSDRKFFRVTFKSNDRLDAMGFNASYVFLDEEENYTMKIPATSGSARHGEI